VGDEGGEEDVGEAGHDEEGTRVTRLVCFGLRVQGEALALADACASELDMMIGKTKL
jgi:hypothetical protein